MVRRTVAHILLSVLALVPCFWLPHIYSVDLPSHAYNAWLTLLAEKGQAPGLYIAPVWTNFVFDVMLVETMRAFGADWAQRISVSACVLLFFWGAFAWVQAWSGRAAWRSVPLLLLITYGWVFQMGFFNFYLGVALCLWGAAVIVRKTPLAYAIGLALIGGSAFCNVIATTVMAPLIATHFALTRVAPQYRIRAAATFTIAGLLLTYAVSQALNTTPQPGWTLLLGGDQLVHSGFATAFIGAAYMVLAGVFLLLLFADNGIRATLLDERVLLLLIAAIVVCAIPWGVQLADYVMPIAFLRDRGSVTVILCFALVWNAYQPTRVQFAVMALLATAAFSVMYGEARAFSQVEQQLVRAVRMLPAGTRVWANIVSPDTRTPLALHLLERACIGHCFNVNNYELLARHFRLRARTDSPIAITDPAVVADLQRNGYRIQQRDLPLALVHNNSTACAPIVATNASAGDPIPTLVTMSWSAQLLSRAQRCAE